MADINKETLEHLAGLARIEISEKDESKLLEDLRKIFDYFEELKEVDTENVEPMVGGNIFSENVFREDAEGESYGNLCGKSEKLKGAFPEKEGGFLKVPPVFE